MKKIILFFVILSGILGNAQENIKQSKQDNDLKLSALPYYSFGKGIGITSPDSLYQLNIRFRMQNRVTYTENEGEDGVYDGQIRRLRLRFDGYVWKSKVFIRSSTVICPGRCGRNSRRRKYQYYS